MKYMLMMHAPKGKGDWEIFNWPPQDIKAHIRLHAPAEQGIEGRRGAGRRRGLDRTAQGPARAGRQRRSAGDRWRVSGETKEFLAGYWIIEVDRRERAYEVAGKASAAPGPGGKPLNMDIEVREVMSVSPVEV